MSLTTYNKGVKAQRAGKLTDAIKCFVQCTESGAVRLQAAYAGAVCSKQAGIAYSMPTELSELISECGAVYVASNLTGYLNEQGHRAFINNEGESLTTINVAAQIDGNHYTLQISELLGSFNHFAWRNCQGAKGLAIMDCQENPQPTQNDRYVMDLLGRASSLPLSLLTRQAVDPLVARIQAKTGIDLGDTGEAEDCEAAPSSRTKRWLLWLAAMLVLGALAWHHLGKPKNTEEDAVRKTQRSLLEMSGVDLDVGSVVEKIVIGREAFVITRGNKLIGKGFLAVQGPLGGAEWKTVSFRLYKTADEKLNELFKQQSSPGPNAPAFQVSSALKQAGEARWKAFLLSNGFEARASTPAATKAEPPRVVNPNLPLLEIIIKPGGATGLEYDTKSLAAKSGQKVKLTLTNTHAIAQAHNWVLTKPGAMFTVLSAATAFTADPKALEKGYIPPSPDILYHTKLVQPGQSDSVEFVAGAPGDYPYLCTFPGHGLLMHGVIKVE